MTYIFLWLTVHNLSFALYKSDRLQIASADDKYNRNGISPLETSVQTDSHRRILGEQFLQKHFHKSKVVISIIFSFQFAKWHERKFYSLVKYSYIKTL